MSVTSAELRKLLKEARAAEEGEKRAQAERRHRRIMDQVIDHESKIQYLGTMIRALEDELKRYRKDQLELEASQNRPGFFARLFGG